ncbi:MAG: zinc ribbon domain-containing protein [Candidatus Woesearchaeota archaeon]|jgi:putative FmdB family regulatory protein
MPVFDYKCNNCGKVFEEFVQGTPEIKCSCGSLEVEKLFSPPSAPANFKGEGWSPIKYHNTTSNIRDHVSGMKEDLNNIKSSDIYNTQPPKDKK